MFSAQSTVNAVQEQYARNEGLTVMYMEHAVHISSGSPSQVIGTGAWAVDLS
jgi:hypothetical protein